MTDICGLEIPEQGQAGAEQQNVADAFADAGERWSRYKGRSTVYVAICLS